MTRLLAVLPLAAAMLAQDAPWTERERRLLERIEQLERRVGQLEAARPAPAAPDAAPQPGAGRRFGFRLDLQWGLAAEAIGGNPANEPRPQVWRNLFQAYGTYVAPLGRGLTVDFGKWASSVGIEGNYTKDQLNYSRSYTFNFLPFYHTGVRANYAFSDRFTAGYWLVNGSGQAEDLNGLKSQNVTLTWKPARTATWTGNYYTGIERGDSRRTHILDTYAAWDASAKVTLAAEADHFRGGGDRVSIGAVYGRYRFTPRWAVAARGEYLSDRGGAFSGRTQALKETTLTADYRPAGGFLLRWEWRRDFSNQPYFPGSGPGLLKREQNTATVGVVWWAGAKEGAW